MFKIANACAQALLAWLITCVILAVLLMNGVTDKAGMTLVELISEFPVFNVWVNLLSSYAIGRSNPEMVVTLTALAYVNVFADSIFVGVVIHVVNSIKEYFEKLKLKRKTVNILSTYLGIIISMVMVRLLKTSGEFYGLLLELAVIGIMLLGIKMIVSGKLLGTIFNLKEFWGIFIDSLYGMLICGYITKIVMVPTSGAGAIGVWVVEVFTFSLVVALAGFVAYLITGKKFI